jgi:hypothetical protein
MNSFGGNIYVNSVSRKTLKVENLLFDIEKFVLQFFILLDCDCVATHSYY